MTAKTYHIRIERSGREFTAEDGETVLAAALRHGLVLPYSCRSGTCGTCKGRIVAGSIDYGVYEEKALSAAERAAGKALLCQARPLSDLVIEAREVVAPADIEVKTLPCRVVKIDQVAHDVRVLSLKLPQNERLRFLAGQYIDILLRDGSRRSFSLANPPQQDNVVEIHVRRVPDGKFTNHVFTELKDKDLLRFRGPLGTFFLRAPEARADAASPPRPALLIAGGTGFAPIKAIVEDVLTRDVKPPLHFYWGARSRRDLYLHELVRGWEQRHPQFRYTPVLSEPRAEDNWDGRTGWVHAAVLADYPDLRDFEVYASGPPPMIEAIRANYPARGLAENQLYYDSFEFAHAAP